MALIGKVEKPARGGDQNINTAAQRLDLRTLSDAAHDDGLAHAHVPAIGPDAVGNLQREFARRRQDQRPRRAWRCGDVVVSEVVQKRQREGCRLAGARLGDAEQIHAVKQQRNGALLNGRGALVSCVFEGAYKRLGEAEFGKS